MTEPTPSTPAIGADVIAQTQRAITEGKTAEYLTWLADNNAPAHIIEYVKNQVKESA